MENLKKILIFALGIVMAFGLTPAFAASPSGTNGVTVGVSPSVSIVVSNNADFGSLAANNILSDAQPINIASTSNVPIVVNVKAADWTSIGGNMPLSALLWGTTPMTTNNAVAIANMTAPTPTTTSAQDVNLKMKVPFGSLPGAYNTTVTWTASDAS